MTKIFCVIGRSGSGKDTLVKRYCDEFNKKNLISYTTREKRPNEGNTHIFISPNSVNEYKNNMIAYTKINGIEYFATDKQLEECDFYIIDPIGYEMLLDKKLNNVKIISILIDAPENIRMERALTRGDDINVFLSRNKNENEQFKNFEINGGYDYKVVNLDFEESYAQFKSIIKREE